MAGNEMLNYIKNVLENVPSTWLSLTTHRLDIYDESQAKSQFLSQFEALFKEGNSSPEALSALPTAYDYIRLGHPLSCVLEWVIAVQLGLRPDQVISFSSKTIPVMAILRRNALAQKETRIYYTGELPLSFNAEQLRAVYAYQFDLIKIDVKEEVTAYDGTTVFISTEDELSEQKSNPHIDFQVSVQGELGSVLLASNKVNEDFISDIQHVRRRESIAMTPANCHTALKMILGHTSEGISQSTREENKAKVLDAIKEITVSPTKALLGSSGLSIQYAIMMGLVHDAQEHHPGKAVKFVVPPNCYGGTNDQARRVAACLGHVEVLDLPVDGEHNMVQSLEVTLSKVAQEDGIAYIIAEIPTNPRVEVPELLELKKVLTTGRKTSQGKVAVDPVFILDQTFCPNVHFLGEGEILSTMRAISYSSGSKFPSGGLCTAGYCVGNTLAEGLMKRVEQHLIICDNEATALQVDILAKQIPSMNQRIQEAYVKTREFVTFIQESLPEAKINFVSEELAAEGFTPSVFSLDLPTKGDSEEEREANKRELNHRLISRMITEIPDESKHCVSYGQLQGCYWTIPATSTQGTTKEGDKDYIARVALSPKMDLEKHKQVFAAFVESM